MIFVAPLWLLSLIPWSVAAVLLLRGFRPLQRVTFLQLWPTDFQQTPHRRWRLPPWPIILLMLSAFLALFAAASPAWVDRSHVQPPRLIIDRGMASLAGNRLQTASEALAMELRSICVPDALLTVTFIPNSSSKAGVRAQTFPVADLLQQITDLGAVPVDTTDQFHRELRRPITVPTIVLSEQTLPPTTGPIVHISSGRSVRNLSIQSCSASDTHLLFTAQNPDSLPCDKALISSAHTPAFLTTLPERNRPTLLPLPAGAPGWLTIHLPTTDDYIADNTFHLARQSRPRLEIQSLVSPDLRRMLDVYQSARNPGGTPQIDQPSPSPSTALHISALPLPPDKTGVSLPTASESASLANIVRHDHPILANVDLPASASICTERPTGEGWGSLLDLNNRPLLAIRTHPTRQVWVGFRSSEWSRTPGYVIFWTNILDWLADTQAAWQSQPTRQLSPSFHLITPTDRTTRSDDLGLWPGIYEDAAGQRIALNAPTLTDTASHGQPDWQKRLREMLQPYPAAVPLVRPLLIAAILLMTAAILMLARRIAPEAQSVKTPDITD